ncbi:hypothetical protein GGS21DRAFT_432318 [Xylaria nigripes]|nr:hypothetical protein GGS21DRAFT_432318 [Xylaria nigripes]
MPSMSRSTSNSLMGFSVHQPAVGAKLQFFPAIGSKQLDDMIDAYIPGNASILDKRAAVSMEFLRYTQATGHLFKFYMVYPALGASNASPTTSESQRTNSSPRIPDRSPPTSAIDFSNLPGMKILTKDGRDVTNSLSRGCKTKEQRDHAHLMRKMKACDNCRRRKTKCDPSHKRLDGPATAVASGKVTKKTSKNYRPSAAPSETPAQQALITSELDQILNAPSPSIDSGLIDSLLIQPLNASIDGFPMEWDQFIQYDQEPTDMIPFDLSFLDSADYFSLTAGGSFSSSSASPSLPITPIDQYANVSDNTIEGCDQMPILPYLNASGTEAGSNYVDFNLFSPQSSFLDEEFDLKEISASPNLPQRPEYQAHLDFAICATTSELASNAGCNQEGVSHSPDVLSSLVRNRQFRDTSNNVPQTSRNTVIDEPTEEWSSSGCYTDLLGDGHISTSYSAALAAAPRLRMAADAAAGSISQGLCGPAVVPDQTSLYGDRSRSPFTIDSSTVAITNVGRRLSGPQILEFYDSNVDSTPLVQESSGLYSNAVLPGSQASHTTTAAAITRNVRSLGDEWDDNHSMHSSVPSRIVRSRTTSRITRASSINVASSAIVNPDEYTAGVPTPVFSVSHRRLRRHISNPWDSSESHTQQNPGLATPRGHENNLGNLTPAKQKLLATIEQSALSSIIPTLSVIAGLSIVAMLALFTSPRTAIIQGLIEDAQSVVLRNIAPLTTALLALSFTPFRPISTALVACTRLSSVGAKAQPSYISASCTRVRHFIRSWLVDCFSAYSKILGCDVLAKLKLRHRTHSRHDDARFAAATLPTASYSWRRHVL